MSTRSIQDTLDRNYSITITYVPNNQSVSFSGYLDTFKDSYKLDWQSESVYGRMDPILFYKNTTRKIDVNINVPADSIDEAQTNFRKLSRLIRFCYPVYEKGQDVKLFAGQEEKAASTPAQVADTIARLKETLPKISGNALLLSSPPLIAVKFSNFISSNSQLNGGKLLGKFDSISFDADKETTYFSVGGNLFPSAFKLSISMDVLHSTALGWTRDERGIVTERTPRFPYKV
jgi:hypothetical protein